MCIRVLEKKVASSCYMEVPNEVNLGSNQEVTSVAAVGTGEDGEEDWIEVTNKANQVTTDSLKILEKSVFVLSTFSVQTPSHWVYSDMISGKGDLVNGRKNQF